MATELKLPELGENVEKGDVIRVLVAPGDVIKVDQPVVELETDKATIEVPSNIAGTVGEIKVKPGDKVKVGQVVLTVEEGGAASKADAPAQKTEAAQAPSGAAATPAAEAQKQTADAEPRPDAERHVERSAAVSQAAPPPAETPKPAAKTASVVDIASGRPAAAAATAPKIDPNAPVMAGAPAAAAPSVRRYARELGVNIGDVPGSGPGGRIGQDDVTKFVKGVMTGGRQGSAAPARHAPLPDFSKWGPVEVKPMSNIRRKTAEHLSIAWQAPHVTQHDKADVTGVEEFRKAHAARAEKDGAKITVTAIVIKIIALAIERYPQFAASVDMANESLVFKNYCHIGVAVDTPNGLLVPVIRDADKKTISQIAMDLATLSQKARDRKLSLDEMSGGVFSVTNLGGIGGTMFTPIVNQPEVAILGLSRTAIEPVWKGDKFEPRPMLPLSLSYDHRVIDGADAARFLRFIADALEQPLSLYL
jgi:pyruvate dehydrogenase E2 component (dihydrolipoamide acetyltransferase)